LSPDIPDRPSADSALTRGSPLKRCIRFAHPAGRTELRALLRYATFLRCHHLALSRFELL